MKPIFIPHDTYQNFVLQKLQVYYGSGFVILNKDWPLVMKFWQTDLSSITTFLQEFYSVRGPLPQDPASMLCSYLIFLMTNSEKGLTEWINIIKRTPIYAILNGFSPRNIPGVGTFYDFFRRL